MPYEIPENYIEAWFTALKDSISQDGCSDELAVCDEYPLIQLFKHKEMLAEEIEHQVTFLYNSMDSTGCDKPFTVVEYKYFETLNKIVSQSKRIKEMSDYIVKVSYIKYDNDEGQDIDHLPKEMVLDFTGIDNAEELEDLVSDEISNRTGFCHKGFHLEIISHS